MTWKELTDRLSAIYIAKNKDYGNSAHKTYLEFGEVALVVRISDKLSRLDRLTSTGEQHVKDESVFDTIGDAVTYLIMLNAEMMNDNPDADTTQDVIDTFAIVRQCDSTDEYRPMPPAHYRQLLVNTWQQRQPAANRADIYLDMALRLMNEYLIRANGK